MTVSRLHPLFQQILSMQDIIRGAEPAATRKRISCNACLDTGGTENGRPCYWCRIGEPDELDEPDDLDDMPLEQALKNMGIEP